MYKIPMYKITVPKKEDVEHFEKWFNQNKDSFKEGPFSSLFEHEKVSLTTEIESLYRFVKDDGSLLKNGGVFEVCINSMGFVQLLYFLNRGDIFQREKDEGVMDELWYTLTEDTEIDDFLSAAIPLLLKVGFDPSIKISRECDKYINQNMEMDSRFENFKLKENPLNLEGMTWGEFASTYSLRRKYWKEILSS